MLEHLPWLIAGLAVGLFVGYAFGKYRGARELFQDLAAEEETAEARPPKPAGASPQSAAEPARTVYIRRGGSHYHKDGCPHLRRRGGQPLTELEAVKKGFKRCPHCRP